MISGLNIILILGFILIAGLSVWLTIVKFAKHESKILNGARFENLAPKYADGCSEGIETNVIIGKNGRYLIKYIRTDVADDELYKIKEETMIVGTNKRLSFPIGDWSNKISRVKYLPPKSEDLPSELKKTKLGKLYMKYTEDIDVENDEIKTIREGSIRKTNILQMLGDGELSSEQFDQQKNFTDNLIKLYTDKKYNNNGER